jgi:AcrR family transcriptional regulator
MARSRPVDFLDRLVGAAAIVFAEKGLKRARMSDVARQLRVAHGTLYNYVESKEALFYLLLAHDARHEPLPLPTKLPVRTPSARALQDQLKRQITEPAALPQLEAALARRRVGDVASELGGILNELYTRVEQGRHATTAIERSALDLPATVKTHRQRVRRRLLEMLATYIERRARQGHFHPPGDPRVAACLLVEAISFFAFARDGGSDRALARKTAIEMLVRGLVSAERR